MKIAVLSDVHGNVPALEAVLEDIAAWQPDRVIVNGDLINRGPDSPGVYRLLLSQVPQAILVKGNHETFTLRCADRPIPPRDDPRHDLEGFGRYTVRQMGQALDEVRPWPDHLDFTTDDGGSIHITHGSRLGNREGILPETEGEELRAKLGEQRDLFIASHTHKPFIRHVDETLVVNTGSVGAPFDRDPRASYGQLLFDGERWRAVIVRVAFDRQRAEQSFERCGFLDEGGPFARIMLTELRQSRGHMGPWMRQYHAAVMAGEISVAAGVDAYLAQLAR